MIQFWTAGTTSPSTNIIIAGNFLDSGNGDLTQSIFMRNEVVDHRAAATKCIYRNPHRGQRHLQRSHPWHHGRRNRWADHPKQHDPAQCGLCRRRRSFIFPRSISPTPRSTWSLQTISCPRLPSNPPKTAWSKTICSSSATIPTAPTTTATSSSMRSPTPPPPSPTSWQSKRTHRPTRCRIVADAI